MNDYNRAFYNTYLVVIEVCNNNLANYNAHPKFNDKFTALTALVDPLEEAIDAAGVNISGVAMQKRESKARLASLVVYISAQLQAYNRAAPDEGLKTGISYAPWETNQMADDALTGVCTRLYGLCATRLSSLGDYGIDATFLADFEAQKEDFKEQIPAPANAAKLRKEAAEHFRSLLNQAQKLLEDLDLLMRYFIIHNPGLYDLYTKSRKVIRKKAEVPAIKGKVIDADGNPLKGVTVSIKGKKGGKHQSTAGGNFKFLRLQDGSYTLLFVKKGLATLEVLVNAPETALEVMMVREG